MNIIEQAEHELHLLMLCKPSTVRGLIAEVTRLRKAIEDCDLHDLHCNSIMMEDEPCDCGLDEWKRNALNP